MSALKSLHGSDIDINTRVSDQHDDPSDFTGKNWTLFNNKMFQYLV
jgi:hypothetical protein